jgi:MerR family transcriptional regulator, redox-sensitive transcriptional activator SoxR
MSELTIGEVARRTGLRTSALRYYEDAGILPPPRRENGRRRYDAGVVRWIRVLRFAQQAGFTLDEIRTLFHGFGAETPLGERWQALAHEKMRELDALIARATQMRRAIEAGLACGCVSVDDCMAGEPASGNARDGVAARGPSPVGCAP